MYWEAITVIEAQNLLLQAKIAMFPSMKKEARAKQHRDWHRLAYPSNFQEGEILTTDQLASKIRSVINVQ